MTVTEPGLLTEFTFELPKGFVDQTGVVHRNGVMRLATARDEILPLRDHRVRDNEAYLTVLLLSRVITRMGTLREVTPSTIEGLFTVDLAFLQNLYRRVNVDDQAPDEVRCPECSHKFSAGWSADSAGRS